MPTFCSNVVKKSSQRLIVSVRTCVGVHTEIDCQRPHMCGRVHTGMRNRRVSAATEAWLDLVDRRVFARHFLGKMVGRWQNKELAGAWAGWQAFVAGSWAAEDEELRKQRVMRNIVLRVKNRAKAAVLYKWVDCIAETKRHRAIMQRAAARIRNRSLTAALATWDEFTLERQRQRALLKRVMNRAANRDPVRP